MMLTPTFSNQPASIGGVIAEFCGGAKNRAPVFQCPHILTYNARSALFILLNARQIQHLWLPSYICQSVLVGLLEHTSISFYPVDANFHIALPTPHSSDDAILIPSYFGFEPLEREFHRENLPFETVIYDACQALPVTLPDWADYTLLSLRKWDAFLDGGVLFGADLSDIELEPPPEQWGKARQDIYRQRQAFDQGLHQNKDWFMAFQGHEAQQPTGFWAASVQAGRQLKEWNLPEIRKRRQANFQRLLKDLAPFALFKDLPKQVTPLGFPMRCENRDTLKQKLIQADIYPPVHWPLPHIPQEFEASHALSQHIITLPCDQRYSGADMHTLAHTVLTCLK